jgi:hypothetical protein
MKDTEIVDLLTNFQAHLNEIGLIGNSGWSFSFQAEKFVYGVGGHASPPKRKEPVYQLTTNLVVYLDGKAKVFKSGECFTLAGLKLSTQGHHSPFHYQDDIIRLPNSAVMIMNSDVAKKGDTIRVVSNKDRNGFAVDQLVKVISVNPYSVLAEQGDGVTYFVFHGNYKIANIY